MEAIRHSKVIIVLLIIYLGISIIVITMDKTQKKDKKSKSNEKDKTTEVQQFINQVSDINDDVVVYLDELDSKSDVCIPLSHIIGDEQSGSVYVTQNGFSIKMWYSNGTYAINNIETNNGIITENDIESEYSTQYFNNCGLNN